MSTPIPLLGTELELSATESASCCSPLAALQLTDEQGEQLAARFKALGHPVRVQIVELLSRCGGQVCVCDIEGQFALSQPTISHHLKVLREAGLVRAETRGLWSFYTLHADAFLPLQVLLGAAVS